MIAPAEIAESDFPWRTQPNALLTPEDHAEMLEVFIGLVEAFELIGGDA